MLRYVLLCAALVAILPVASSHCHGAESDAANDAELLKKLSGQWTTIEAPTSNRPRIELEFVDKRIEVAVYRTTEPKPWIGSLKIDSFSKSEGAFSEPFQLKLGGYGQAETFSCDFVGDRLIIVGQVRRRPYEGLHFSGEYKKVDKK